MSERVISDPTVAGWELNPDTGYWMWAAGSGGGGGSIQDGDTEGQITTWDGDEWTPEGAVVVGDGLEIDGAVIASGGLTQGHRTDAGVFQYGANLTRIRSYGDVAGSGEFAIEIGGGGGSKTIPALTIDADGDVNIIGKLFVNGVEVGGAVDAYTKSESDGRYVPKSGNTTISGTLTATDFVTS